MKFRTKIILIALAAAIAVAGIITACVLLIKPDNKPPVVPPDNPPGIVTDPDDFKNIKISGADDIKIVQGVFFDCFSGVSAVSGNGTNLTAHLNVTGNINTAKVGEYNLVYSVKDLSGNKTEKTRKVTVVSNPEIGKVKPVPVYTVEGTYNIANGCSVYSNSVYGAAAANKACDGDFSTRWESVHGVDGVNFTVDLGASLSFNEINIYWEDAYALDFNILTSDDGESWQTLKEAEDNAPVKQSQIANNVHLNNYKFDNEVTARFIRIAASKRKTSYGYSIFEFEVMGKTGTVIPAAIYPDLFDAENDGHADWAIETDEWLEFDLGSVKNVNRIRLAFQNNLTPAAYSVMYAGADKNWQTLKTYNLPYSADWFRFNGENDFTVKARYFKIQMDSRRFVASAYRISEVAFVYAYNDAGEQKEDKLTASVTASSSKAGHGVSLATDGKDDTYWENDNSNVYQTVNLGGVKSVGRVDLYWRGDDGGKGKFYDLEISADGENWTTVFRQTHGATAKQSVYVYENAQFIRIKDYQSPDTYRYMLEGMVVHCQYPASSGEGKINYDVSLAFPQWSVIADGNGSYLTGGTDFPSSRLIAYLDDELRGKPVPSNDWWQGLLIADKGYNMYMNPITATFKSDGLWLTNPGAGYFDGFVPGNGSQTVNVDAHDIVIGYAGMGNDAEVRVTGYSDYGISAVMTDSDAVDKLTVFLSEGTLYAYCIYAEPEKAQISAENLICIYDLNGNEILKNIGAKYTGDGIVAMVRTHSGYEGGIRKYKDSTGAIQENKPVYEERYYVVSVPENTEFVRGESAVSVKMTEGNYMSVGAVGQKNAVSGEEPSDAQFPLKEVELLHGHGYAFVVNTSCLYGFDGKSNTVTTEFRVRTMLMREGFSAEAYSAYLPHQIAKSDYKEGYVYASVRGDCRSHTGNLFTTKDNFYGVVPTFVEPTDSGYSARVLYDQLVMVYENNGGDKTPENSNLISSDPYWQGKNLHPMAMAALAADQIGATDLRDKFLDKIEYILTDWFTYDKEKDAATGAYFYYDGEWGTLYYKNSEFGAGVNLADHYFTYGYYTLAAGVLTSYRPGFADEWGNMIELLIRDYMNPSRVDDLFPYMRNFDPFAGHGWAGGYADNNGGNNQESAGEALNSWVGAYLYATAVGNETVRQAAIYGYTTELNAIKHYWFNYFNDFPESYPYGVVGQVYGGSNFFGTFFNGQPLYMYGIHLIPGEEYLTSYAMSDMERERLENLIDTMRKEQRGWDVEEKDKEINAWQHIFIPIVAIYDADEALQWYDEVLAKQGNVGNTSEQFNVYWLIHGMKSCGLRTTDIWAENGATATVYKKNGGYSALCWNPTGQPVKYTFRNKDGVTGSALIPAHSLVSCDPMKETFKFENYTAVSDFTVAGAVNTVNSTISEGQISFGSGGSASYLLTFGSEQRYYKINLAGADGNVKLLIDGVEIPLVKTANGYESKPVSISFKHIITVSGSNVKVTAIEFEKLELALANVKMTATASSEENPNNSAAKAVDGDMESRWESVHKSDNEWLEIELEELTEIYQLRVYWEAASAKEYKVYLSETGDDGDWTEVFYGSYSQGKRTDLVNPSKIMKTKFIRIEGISRMTDYGYSVYEIEIYNFNNNQGAK